MVLVKQNIIDALPHTEVTDIGTPPTCTEAGISDGKHCAVCGTVTVAQEALDALGHTEVIDEAVDATCTESGLTEGKHCSVCDEVLVEQQTVDALGHEMGEWVDIGSNTLRSDCSRCDHYETKKAADDDNIDDGGWTDGSKK